jgi:hypothetical protein
VTTDRAFCRACKRVTSWWRSGTWNHDNPPATYWRCRSCSTERIALADLTDAEQVCRNVIDERHLPQSVDREEAYGVLLEVLWRSYKRWNPARVRTGSTDFTPYAIVQLRYGLSAWLRGKAKTRDGALERQAFEFALVRLDALANEGSALAELVGALHGDSAADSASDLARALARRDSEVLREEARMGLGPPARVPA